MFFKNKENFSFIIVGLGNPGSKYEDTRHNVGFRSLDYIADKYNIRISKVKFSALYNTIEIKGKKGLLLKPQTFMNLSGKSVSEAAKFYKISAENIIIIYDDISLDVGKLRIRNKGSAGGHNGIKSIISYFGDEFPRIKVGVGKKPHPDYDLANWVLSDFSKSEKDILSEQYKDILDCIELMIIGDADKAMNKYSK